jgi:hypothetical protein
MNLACDARMFDLPRLKSLPVTLQWPSGVSKPSLQRLSAIISQAVAEVLPKANTIMRGRRIPRQRPTADLS